MRSVINYLAEMLSVAIIAVPFSFLWRKSRKKHFLKAGIETTKEHEIVSVLFIMFLAALISQTVIPDFFINDDGVLLFNRGYDRINLTPFKEIRRALNVGGSFFIVNFIGNLAVFAPIAFFIALLYNSSGFFKCVLITAICSIVVEVCQIPQDRGTDIDDVILNTLGGIIGYIIYLILKKALPKFVAKCKVKINKSETQNNENTDL